MNGFFLGGAAEGMAEAEKQQLARDQLAQEAALRTRALDITDKTANANIGINERAQTLAEKNAAREAGKDALTRADKHLSDTMSLIADTVKTGVTAGKDPAAIHTAIAPLVDSAKRMAVFAKQDPSTIDAKVGAFFQSPTATEVGTATGTQSGAAKVAEDKVTTAAGLDKLAQWKTLDEKLKAENTLRDDYLKQSQSFITIRDAKNRLEASENSGAGDIALLFQYMKILDPGSTVREGEFATAGSVAGVPGQIEGMRRQLVGGGRLSDAARNQIKSQAQKLFEAAGLQQDRNTTQFATIARKNKLDVDSVVPDITAVPRRNAAGGNLPPPPAGFNPVN